MGVHGDSFYEYLLKIWLLSGQPADGSREVFDVAMEGILKEIPAPKPKPERIIRKYEIFVEQNEKQQKIKEVDIKIFIF